MSRRRKIHPYVLKVDRPTGWKALSPEQVLKNFDYMRTTLPSENIHVPKGTLVEFDPLSTNLDEQIKSINVISLDDQEVKVSVLLSELRPLDDQSQFELLLPLTPQQRYDIVSNPVWRSILEVKLGDTVWFYQSSQAASVAAKSRLNGNYGHVNNSSDEKDVGFVRYIGPLEKSKKPGFKIGVELFLEANRGHSNGTLKSTRYFEAGDQSSVFTTLSHLFPYDEDLDVNQVRQKIGQFENNVQGLRTSKRNIMKQFEKDRQTNRANQDSILGKGKIFRFSNI